LIRTNICKIQWNGINSNVNGCSCLQNTLY
jgi:hypothetical protein